MGLFLDKVVFEVEIAGKYQGLEFRPFLESRRAAGKYQVDVQKFHYVVLHNFQHFLKMEHLDLIHRDYEKLMKIMKIRISKRIEISKRNLFWKSWLWVENWFAGSRSGFWWRWNNFVQNFMLIFL